MQNSALIRTFAILFGLVSIYQLSFTFIAGNEEAKAKAYASQSITEETANYLELRERAERNYLDSIGDTELYLFTSYRDAKEKELNRGLDLKGGINVILQISVRDILEGLTENSKNIVFNQALQNADSLQRNSDEPYVESFFKAFDAIKGFEKLATPDIFANRTLQEEITFDMTDAQAQSVIRRKVDESVVSAFEVLRKRIDKFGVAQPNIQRLGTSGRILIELPGAKDVARVQNLLQSTAQLEFWETIQNQQLIPFLAQANEVVKEIKKAAKTQGKKVKTAESAIDELLADVTVSDSLDPELNANPILDLIRGYGYQGGPVIAQFSVRDSDEILGYLNMPEVRRLLPAEYRYVKFAWGKPLADSDTVELFALRSNRDDAAPLSGGVVVDAIQTYDQVGKPAVSMQMDATGARIWETMTGKAYRERTNIAIVLDDVVYSAPGVSSGAIAGGRSEITGSFSLNEAIDLANVLRAGKLPASAEIIQSEIVGPSLGQEAIQSGIYSFAIALLFVLVWMMFYYGRSGFFADIALLFNILLIFGILAGLGLY